MPDPVTAAPFSAETAVERDDGVAGRYRARLSDGWSAPVLPQGGMVTAVGLRAMVDALDAPDQRLRSVSVAFAAQVAPGDVIVDVQVLRRGRTMSQATATVRNPDQPAGHTSIAVFGGVREGFSFTDVRPPDVAPPDQCRSFRDPWPDEVDPPPRWSASFWDRVESRQAIGHAPWDVWTPATSERAYWYRYDEPPLGPDGLLDPVALAPLCDTMPGAVWERIGPGAPPFASPSADLTVQVVGEAGSGWLLAHNRARFAGEGYASLEMTLWDPDRGLAAYATQLCFFSFRVPGADRAPSS